MKSLLATLAVALATASALTPAVSAQSATDMAAAATRAEQALKVGATIPSIAVTTADGASATFASLKGEKGLTVAFVRSADWCPFCKKQLKELDAIAPELKAAGYPLVALSYDPPETLKAFATKNALRYSLVSDAGSKTIDAFGLRNKDVAKNPRFNGIPNPAIYVIGANGIVKARLMEERYQDRPPAPLVLETVRGLR